MKPIRTVLALIVMGAGLAACHSHDDDLTVTAVEEPRDIVDCFNAEGQAYLNLQISSLASGYTRAGGDNSQFNDGDGETAVKDVTLLLFRGTADDGEDNVKLCSAYTIDNSGFTDDVHDQVSHHKQFVHQIVRDNILAGDKLYALVVINSNGMLQVTTSTHELSITHDVSGTETTSTGLVAAATTFGAIKEMILTTIGTAETGLMMSNSPLSSLAGGTKPSTGAGTTVLTAINPSLIYPTEEEARQHPNCEIFVERAAAKVTIGLSEDNKGYILGNPSVTYTAANLEYAIDKYNDNFYLVRHFSKEWLDYNTATGGDHKPAATDYYRFADQNSITGNEYRTYWAKDINYSVGTGLIDYQEADFQPIGTANARYIAENTMSTGCMTLDKTTSIIFRLKLNNGKDFFTTELTGEDQTLGEDNTTPPSTEWGTTPGSSLAPRRAAGDDEIKSFLRKWLLDDETTRTKVQKWLDDYASGNRDNIDFTIEDQAGPVKVTEVSTTLSTAAKTALQAIKISCKLTGETTDADHDLVEIINDRVKITRYKNGYCYYRVPIKHFGQELTPWIGNDKMTDQTSISQYYGSTEPVRENAYLGRYGIVRNNWYQVEVTQIRHIGSATPPTTSSNVDDFLEEAISLKVSTLPWLLNEHDIEF